MRLTKKVIKTIKTMSVGLGTRIQPFSFNHQYCIFCIIMYTLIMCEGGIGSMLSIPQRQSLEFLLGLVLFLAFVEQQLPLQFSNAITIRQQCMITPCTIHLWPAYSPNESGFKRMSLGYCLCSLQSNTYMKHYVSNARLPVDFGAKKSFGLRNNGFLSF